MSQTECLRSVLYSFSIQTIPAPTANHAIATIKGLSPCGSDASAIWWWFTTTFGINVIDAFYGDRERAVFESSYPAFFLQIPEMKLQILTRTAGQAFKFVM